MGGRLKDVEEIDHFYFTKKKKKKRSLHYIFCVYHIITSPVVVVVVADFFFLHFRSFIFLLCVIRSVKGVVNTFWKYYYIFCKSWCLWSEKTRNRKSNATQLYEMLRLILISFFDNDDQLDKSVLKRKRKEKKMLQFCWKLEAI